MSNINPFKNLPLRTSILGAFVMVFVLISCKKELPGVGSIPDQTPPEANFSFAQLSPSNYLQVTFLNTSTSATDYHWDFGDGLSSAELEPVHVYPAEGKYTVTLSASDKLGVTSTKELEIEIIEPTAFIPPVLEGGFEDGTLTGGTGDGRDSWKNSDLGGTIQITSSPVNGGSQAAKLPGDPSDQRIGYQLLTVTEKTVYDLTFYYTMFASPQGSLTVSILSGPVSSHEEALAATIGSKTVNDQSNPGAYVKETVSFYSGDKKEVAIYFYNGGSVETRLDDISIDLSTGPIPVVAAFSYQADSADFHQINFTNTSSNANLFVWDFGDGSSSTIPSPSHTYAAEGTYNVTLTASNTQGSSATTSLSVQVKEPSSVFVINPSFDDESVRDDNRIAWSNPALEADADVFFGASDYILQTSTTARTGAYAGKLPTAENSAEPRRWLYQAITVEPNTDYKISGWIRNKDAGVGSTITFEIYDAPFSTASNIGDANAIIKSADFDASTGHDTNVWTEATITFNSGSSTEIVLFITNDYTLNGDPDTEESESFLDDFLIIEL